MKRLKKSIQAHLKRHQNKIDWLSRTVVGIYVLTWLVSIAGALLHKITPEFVPLLDRWIIVLSPFVGWILQRRIRNGGNSEKDEKT
jgi:hypothetical protein